MAEEGKIRTKSKRSSNSNCQAQRDRRLQTKGYKKNKTIRYGEKITQDARRHDPQLGLVCAGSQQTSVCRKKVGHQG